MPINKMPSIRDSFLFNTSNKSGVLDKNMSLMMTKGVKLTEQAMQYEFDTINRYFKFPMKINVMEAFRQGKISAYYAPKMLSAKVPPSLPFVNLGGSSIAKGVAFIDNYVSIDKTGDVSMDAKKLYCYLEGTYASAMITQYFGSIVRQGTVTGELCSIYAHMFTRVLNKKFALNVDKRAKAKVLFLAAKFYLIRLLGYEDDTFVFNSALKVSSDISPVMVRELNDTFSHDVFQDISTFITAISTMGYMITNGLKNYTVREFIKDFVDMYGSIALFAIEDFRYYIFNIVSAVNGGFLNKQYIFDDLIGDNPTIVSKMLSQYMM